jgi:hypothetical protein
MINNIAAIVGTICGICYAIIIIIIIMFGKIFICSFHCTNIVKHTPPPTHIMKHHYPCPPVFASCAPVNAKDGEMTMFQQNLLYFAVCPSFSR